MDAISAQVDAFVSEPNVYFVTVESTSIKTEAFAHASIYNYQLLEFYISDVYYQPESKSVTVLKSKNVSIPIELSCSISGSTQITYR